ncbi:MAG: hypothetical protein QM751_03595 [Paludibacteraceae bacterium]
MWYFLGAIIGKFTNLLFDGAIDAHYSGGQFTFIQAIIVSLVDVTTLFLTMIAGAYVLTKNFRIIDILGTMTFARTPFLLMAVLALFVKQPEYSEIIKQPTVILTYPMFLVFVLLSIPIMVWIIALMYHAFKVSTGTNGAKLTSVFIVALVVAEITSKVLILLFVHNL